MEEKKKYKHEILAEKREKRKRNKEILVERIIDDLKANIYDSEEYIWSLCRETLMARTNKELKEICI